MIIAIHHIVFSEGFSEKETNLNGKHSFPQLNSLSMGKKRAVRMLHMCIFFTFINVLVYV